VRFVVGLGNPGPEYAATRHNVGFRVIEALARRRGIRLDRRECRSDLGWDDVLALAAPQTYMNRSGYAARCLCDRYGVEPDALLVVYDEVHLPLGTLRLRGKGSPAGHRGMESVIENLATDEVPRLRLGVAPEDGPPAGGEDLVEFVLSPFAPGEEPTVTAMVQRAAEACETWAREGIEAALRLNGRVAADDPPRTEDTGVDDVSAPPFRNASLT